MTEPVLVDHVPLIVAWSVLLFISAFLMFLALSNLRLAFASDSPKRSVVRDWVVAMPLTGFSAWLVWNAHAACRWTSLASGVTFTAWLAIVWIHQHGLYSSPDTTRREAQKLRKEQKRKEREAEEAATKARNSQAADSMLPSPLRR